MRRKTVAHRGLRLVLDRPRRHPRANARHHGVAIVEHELEQFTLHRAVFPVDRPDPRDVARIVVILGGEIHQDDVAVLEPRGVAVIVHVPDVIRAGGRDRAIALESGAAGQEDVAGDCVELILEDARPRALHRLDQPAAGELGGPADQGDLARALHGADAVEDRRQVVDPARGNRVRSNCTNWPSRDGRLSQ